MATMDELRQQWRDHLTRDQRPRIKSAAEDRALTAETVKLLGDTGCSLSAVRTQWENKPASGWTWVESIRQFVLASS